VTRRFSLIDARRAAVVLRSHIGVITVNDFFNKIVHEKRGMFGDAVFELVGESERPKEQERGRGETRAPPVRRLRSNSDLVLV